MLYVWVLSIVASWHMGMHMDGHPVENGPGYVAYVLRWYRQVIAAIDTPGLLVRYLLPEPCLNERNNSCVLLVMGKRFVGYYELMVVRGEIN
jgi:hypothetical protein